jgi:hypothetical protein
LNGAPVVEFDEPNHAVLPIIAISSLPEPRLNSTSMPACFICVNVGSSLLDVSPLRTMA